MQRYALLDTIRGFLILNMVVYHALWDIIFVFGVKLSWFEALPGALWENFICCGFIFLSGLCFRLGKSRKKHIKNGLTVFFCGALVTAVTVLVMPPEGRIYFGVLTFIGSAMLILVPLENVLKKASPAAATVLTFALFVLLKGLGSGKIAMGQVQMPAFLYKGAFMTYLGFKAPGFYSADYFPLLPWLMLYLCGYFASPLLIEKENKLLYGKVPILDIAGRHSLLIYMLHQPVVYGLVYAAGSLIQKI